MSALVLVVMSLEPRVDRTAVKELAKAVGATVAYLQTGEPTVVAELDRLAAAGVTEVRLVRVPHLPGAPTPARSWLRRVAAHWVRQNPGIRVEVVGTETTGPSATGARVTGTEAPLESAAWEQVPHHRHQVYLCRGPRCSAKGADRNAEVLARCLSDRGLEDDDILITNTGCTFPCNAAPVIVVHPDDVWYGPVTEADIPRLVDEHLLGGRILGDLQRPRQVHSD